MTELAWPLCLIFAGLVLLFLGGEALVRGSSILALRLGMTPLIAGLTVVAFGTSAPELVVSIKAALSNQGPIAIGNVLGSNILNIGLILGITALIHPMKVRPRTLKIDVTILIAATLIAEGMLADLQIGRMEGGLLVSALFAYTSFSVVSARRRPPWTGAEGRGSPVRSAPPGSLWRDLAFILVGLVLLVMGSRSMVEGASTFARGFGISEAVIGLTIVAMGTSLPELTACGIAALKKKPDIALGNIIGSSIFNLLGILGTAALVKPMVGTGLGMADFYVTAIFTVALLPILGSGYALQRWEGALLICGYLSYMVWLWPK